MTEGERLYRNRTQVFRAPLTPGEKELIDIGQKITRPTLITGGRVNRFCGPCDNYKLDGTCYIQTGSDLEQLRSAADQYCYFARVDGQRGEMTGIGFTPRSNKT